MANIFTTGKANTGYTAFEMLGYDYERRQQEAQDKMEFSLVVAFCVLIPIILAIYHREKVLEFFKFSLATPPQRLSALIFGMHLTVVIYYYFSGENPFLSVWECNFETYSHCSDADYFQRLVIYSSLISMVGLFWPYTYGRVINWIRRGH